MTDGSEIGTGPLGPDGLTEHDRSLGRQRHHDQHPAYAHQLERRAADRQLRVADAITRFAGSMSFIYIHIVVFALWCSTGLFGKDRFPFNFLTLTVSLEAIFLSTFVMIGQNRQSAFASAKADHDVVQQEQELKRNTDLTRQVHAIVLALQDHQAEQAEQHAVKTPIEGPAGA